MKMMKRMQTIALSVALTGLSTLPVWAFTGDVDPSAVKTDMVTCINYTTNESVPGQLLSSGQFDCSALDFQQGERVGVVVSGLAGNGSGPVDPDGCQTLQEQAGTGFTDVGPLAANKCVTITAQIDRPVSSQDPDTWDIFRVTLNGATNLNLQLEPGGNADWGLYLGDPQAGQIINQCDSTTCQIPVDLSVVDVIVVANAPAPYRLTIGAGASGGLGGMTLQSKVGDAPLSVYISGAY